MRHYVCTGDCVAVASQPGLCSTEGCDHEGSPLTECNCNDEMHDQAFEKAAHTPSLASFDQAEDEPNEDDLLSLEEELADEDEESQ